MTESYLKIIYSGSFVNAQYIAGILEQEGINAQKKIFVSAETNRAQLNLRLLFLKFISLENEISNRFFQRTL